MKTNVKRDIPLTHEFVEFIPDPKDLKDRTIYVSIPFATAVHKCCCGCGKQVITPLTPTDWSLTFDGVSVSLEPSVGNWSFDCGSHYWITKNRAIWSSPWSQEEIDRGRSYDRRLKARHYKKFGNGGRTAASVQESGRPVPETLWSRLKKLFR